MRARGADPARLLAARVVMSVDTDGAYSNLLLPRLLREHRLAGRDAAFATELTYGALRWQGICDVVIEAAARRSVAELDPPVRALLRTGAYQLLQMRTPPHAAVHETVEAVRAECGHRPVGLVNAVLRKVSAASWDDWVQRLAPADEIGRIAFTRGYPEWIVSAVADALADDRGELDDALAEDRPVTHLVARPGRIDREALLAAAGADAIAGPWSPYAVRMGGGDPADLAAVRNGTAAVQDEGSQLVTVAAVRAAASGDGGTWLDMCAGPGGKASLLAGLLPDNGRLLAADVQPHRARLVAAAVGDGAVAVVADGRAPAWPANRFDRVLLDAPCTGLGALRRRPEVRWRRRPDDVDRLRTLQGELLRSALEAVRPGGVVAYVTCSPHRAETTALVDDTLAGRPDVRRLDAATVVDVPRAARGLDVQLWPHRHGTDAMYLALLSRTGPS